MQFDQLFSTATANDPFPYQRAFATADVLPEVLEAPTGAGKTATAVLGWLWRRRFAPDDVRTATPRRLVFCLPMRSLVNQTVTAVETWLERVGLRDDVAVIPLLGGAVNNNFDARPEADAILVGTQDQLLSRALNRGYAMSRFRWPMHYALLNNDCLWVMDEVQLMGVGLSTTAQLAALRRSWGVCGPSASLWMSATMDTRLLQTVDAPSTERPPLGLGDADRAHPLLRQRLDAPKELTLRSDLFADDEQAYVDALAEAVRAKHEPGTRTLVVLNRVSRAQALYALLRDHDAALLHSRFRPTDRRGIEARVLARDWQGMLIATQAIEAGVDISSKHMFTELSSWSSLVQRFGRTNRTGEWTAQDPASITVIDIAPTDGGDEAKTAKAYASRALPYTPEELDHARALVRAHDNAAPAALSRGHAADVNPTSPVIRRRDAYELFDTTPDLNGRDIDVSRFIRDQDNLDVQLAWRTWDGDVPPPDAPALHANELCTVPFKPARDFITKATKKDKNACWAWDSLEGSWERAFTPIPGHVYLLSARIGGYDESTGWSGNRRHVPAPVELEEVVAQDEDTADRLTHSSRHFVLLAQHAAETKEECGKLRDVLAAAPGYDTLPWDLIEEAAQWHDLGKAHEAFQKMLVSALPPGDARRDEGPWAKSDGRRGGARCERRHFRHELASALAMIAHGKDDLAAYLAACHHGKVRLAIRSRPTEPAAPKGVPFALGVHEGDKLPPTALGGGVVVPQSTLSLDVMMLGRQHGRLSWAARAATLVEIWGPFRLALMEAIVRVADWRASKRHNRDGEDVPHA